jgi:hypothetical protein
MSTTIQDTVANALNERGMSSYVQSARPVVDLLKARERDLAEALLSYATDLGADSDEVRAELSKLGMEVPDAEPEDDEDDDDEWTDERINAEYKSIKDMLDSLRSDVEALKTAARRNGITV